MKFKGYNNKSRIRQRQEEAIERQKAYDSRGSEQQLKLVRTRPGESKKEKHRLVTLIEDDYKSSKRKNKK